MSRRDLSAIALTAALIPLNSTLIALALPDVPRVLDGSVGATAWLVSGYLIVTVAVQPPAGKLGDRFGRGRAMSAGLVGFSLASVASALAPTLGVLIATRVLLGCFGSLMFANALASCAGSRRGSGGADRPLPRRDRRVEPAFGRGRRRRAVPHRGRGGSARRGARSYARPESDRSALTGPRGTRQTRKGDA